MIIWLYFILVFIVFILSIFFIFPWITGAPYEPTHKKQLKQILKFANIKKNDKIVDLGSGDGRLVIEFAKKGSNAYGFEINPFLVLFSRIKIKKLGLEKNATIYWKSFWKADLSKYNIIVLFQFKTIIKSLQNKIIKESKTNTKIISNTWEFPKWKYKKRNGVYCYKIN